MKEACDVEAKAGQAVMSARDIRFVGDSSNRPNATEAVTEDERNYDCSGSGNCHDARQVEKIHCIGAQTLMEEILNPPTWVVDGLLPTSCTGIIGARPKTGKSTMSIQLGHSVATGTPFLGRKTTKSPVLYLALEDVKSRLQKRLFSIADESTDDFVIATEAATLGTGLIDQLEAHLEDYPGTKLIIIDTLQIVRDTEGDYSYASDYADLRKLKGFADRNDLCLLVITHLRKMVCPNDAFMDISGTTGISGAVDQMMVLKKDERHSKECTLTVTGRDIPDAEYRLRRTGFKWELVEQLTQEEYEAQAVPACIAAIAHRFAGAEDSWTGTASDLKALCGLEENPNSLGKFLSQYHTWMADQGIMYTAKRTSAARIITLTPIPVYSDGDGKLNTGQRSPKPSWSDGSES